MPCQFVAEDADTGTLIWLGAMASHRIYFAVQRGEPQPLETPARE